MRNNPYQHSPEYCMYKLSEIWLPLKKVPLNTAIIRTKEIGRASCRERV